MLPWTRSKWFRRAVTGFSTLFVGVVLATSLMAEGSALKRADVEYEAVDCRKSDDDGRARPAKGCKRKKRVVIPMRDDAVISQDELATALDELPRLKGPRGLTGPRGQAGRNGRQGQRGEAGARGENGQDGAPGRPGEEGKQGLRGAKGDDG